MGNNIMNLANETRCMFGCSVINKLARTGKLVAGDLTPLTDIASLVTAFTAKKTAVTTMPSEVPLWDAIIRECCWLNELGILTTAIITGLTSVRGTSANTDLRFNFSTNIVSYPTFDASLEEFTASASGSTIY